MRRTRNRFPEWAIIVIIVAAVVAIAVAVVALSISGIFASNQETRTFSGPSSQYIARIKIVGEIGGGANRFVSSDSSYHHKWTMQTIDALIGDTYNKGICLWLDTPGGAVYESDELYLKLMEYKEKTGRPIYAYMRRIAASGGYYAAASADEIFANRNTWTGSIGVSLGTLFDVSEFLESHGIRTETITSGRNKAMGSYYEPLTDEQREIYQSLLDDAYDRFVAIVAQGRGMSDKEARALSDGRIFTAEQALEAGLIDGILGEAEAEKAIRAKFEDGAVIYDCYYRPDPNYLTVFGSIFGGGHWLLELMRGADAGAAEAAYKEDVAAVLELTREQTEAGIPPLKYLYTG